MYSHARAASFIYQAVLRSELTRSLGVEWSSVHQGIGEIRGVPVAVTRAFSRRRADIEAALEARGASGPRAAEAAALATRERKLAVEPSRLSDEWRRRALAAGMPEHELLVGRGGPVRVDEDSWARIAAELVRRDGLTSERSTFSRRDVIQELCDRLPAGATVDARALEGAADRVLAIPEIVALLPANSSVGERESFRRRDGRRLPVDREEFRYTTAELLATERRVISAVEDRRDVGAGRADRQHVDGVMAARPTLSGEQREMVRSLLLDGARIAVVAGHAGTGKTFALAVAREAWAAAGYEILGAAVARRAALELQADAGIPSRSVTALLASLRRRPLPPCAVVVLDEASMVGTRQLAALLDRVQSAEAKLVLVGDHRQLPELAAGGAFRGMVRRGLAVELRENRRQSQTWERAAVEDLRDGRIDEAIAAYDAHGRLNVAASLDDAKQRLVADWWEAGSGEDAVMIAARRSDVSDLNARAREHMRAAGRLGHEELRLPAGRFAAGDRLVVKHNDQALGVANGERGTVVDVDPRERTLGLALADGRRVRLDRRFLRSRTRTGDPTLTHGYAITGHVAQGMTADRAFVLAAEGISSEWGYTALTRGRESNHLYVAARTPARDEFAPRGRRPTRWNSSSVTWARAARSRWRSTRSMPSSPAFRRRAGWQPKTSGSLRRRGPWSSTACAGCPAAAARFATPPTRRTPHSIAYGNSRSARSSSDSSWPPGRSGTSLQAGSPFTANLWRAERHGTSGGSCDAKRFCARSSGHERAVLLPGAGRLARGDRSSRSRAARRSRRSHPGAVGRRA